MVTSVGLCSDVTPVRPSLTSLCHTGTPPAPAASCPPSLLCLSRWHSPLSSVLRCVSTVCHPATHHLSAHPATYLSGCHHPSIIRHPSIYIVCLCLRINHLSIIYLYRLCLSSIYSSILYHLLIYFGLPCPPPRMPGPQGRGLRLCRAPRAAPGPRAAATLGRWVEDGGPGCRQPHGQRSMGSVGQDTGARHTATAGTVPRRPRSFLPGPGWWRLWLFLTRTVSCSSSEGLGGARTPVPAPPLPAPVTLSTRAGHGGGAGSRPTQTAFHWFQ